MRVFVSGQLDEKEQIREIYALIEAQGHVITHDWTRTDNLVGRYRDQPEEAGIRAAKDIRGVLGCDIYIIVTDNARAGKGMYVELGAALALHQQGQRPEILLVGPMNHESIFYHHPSVTYFDSIEACLDHTRSQAPSNLVQPSECRCGCPKWACDPAHADAATASLLARTGCDCGIYPVPHIFTEGTCVPAPQADAGGSDE